LGVVHRYLPITLLLGWEIRIVSISDEYRIVQARMALSGTGENYLRDWIAPILLSTVTIFLVSLLLREARTHLTALHIWDDPEDLALAYVLPTIFITVLFGGNIGLLSVLIGGLAAAYFIYPPEFNIQIDKPEHLVELAFFVVLPPFDRTPGYVA
jgi:K+-sensing histidine kinase KdpD